MSADPVVPSERGSYGQQGSGGTSPSAFPPRLVGRLSLYRRLLEGLVQKGHGAVYSHDLAEIAGGTAAQVRRDLMIIGCSGSPARGYDAAQLIERIGDFLDEPGGQRAVLVGAGNLGRAILSYFAGRRDRLSIVAAFDRAPGKVDRAIHGCRCHPIETLAAVIRDKGATIGIVTVPAADAQAVTDVLVSANVRGIVNFAPVHLRVPPQTYVEDVDLTTSLEKVAYFARDHTQATRNQSA